LRETDGGIKATVTGGKSAIVALDDLVGSATLVAVMVKDSAVGMFAGAAYRPFDRVPMAGLRLQMTAVLAVLFADAVNC
jgi:hypothetical protein